MEAHWETEGWAPLRIGGIPDEEAETTSYSIDIPGGLSFLSFMDPSAEVRGLKEFPREDRPPVTVVHVAFQIMVGCGMAMMGVAALFGWRWWRGGAVPTDPRTLKILVAATPLGLIALEAGWTVTEVGRQPWIIKGVLRTADAVTPMPHLTVPFLAFSGLFLMLGIVTVVLLRRIVFAPAPDAENETEGGPCLIR
jgi:cytochrome d ubiquinol oxidase subunit I